MVRPILVKMKKAQVGEEISETVGNNELAIGAEKKLGIEETVPKESPKLKPITPLIKSMDEKVCEIMKKPMIIPQSDDETLKSRNLVMNAVESVKSSTVLEKQNEGSKIGFVVASSQKKPIEPSPPQKIKVNKSNDSKNILRKTDVAPPRAFRNNFLGCTTEEEKRALLRKYSHSYDVGPRVVSEPVIALRDTISRKIPGSNLGPLADKNAMARMRNNFGSVLAAHQSPQLNGLDLSTRVMNPWAPPSAHDINPLVLNAYMKTMQAQQTLRQNQALLEHDRRMMLNQALSQQHAMNRSIHGAGVNHNSNLGLPFLMENRVLEPNYNTYSAPNPSKEDLNKNAVSALDYIAKMGKNKRGRPKRNPAEGWPKRPLSAYNIFFKECREKIVGEESSDKSDAPEKSNETGDPLKPHSRRKRRKKHGKISFGGLAKSVGSMWKELSPESMSYYERKAEESREAYRKEIKLFLEKRNKAFEEKKNTGNAE